MCRCLIDGRKPVIPGITRRIAVADRGNRSARQRHRVRPAATQPSRSGLGWEDRRREHFFQRGRPGIAAAVATYPLPQAVDSLTGDFGMAGTGGAVVQCQVVTAPAACEWLRTRPRPAAVPEPAAYPADSYEAGTDCEAEGIQHEWSVRIRIAGTVPIGISGSSRVGAGTGAVRREPAESRGAGAGRPGGRGPAVGGHDGDPAMRPGVNLAAPGMRGRRKEAR